MFHALTRWMKPRSAEIPHKIVVPPTRSIRLFAAYGEISECSSLSPSRRAQAMGGALCLRGPFCLLEADNFELCLPKPLVRIENRVDVYNSGSGQGSRRRGSENRFLGTPIFRCLLTKENMAPAASVEVLVFAHPAQVSWSFLFLRIEDLWLSVDIHFVRFRFGVGSAIARKIETHAARLDMC